MYGDAEMVFEDEGCHGGFVPYDDRKTCTQIEGSLVGIVDAEVGPPNAGTALDGVAVPHQSPVGGGGANELVGRDASVIGGVVPSVFCFGDEA